MSLPANQSHTESTQADVSKIQPLTEVCILEALEQGAIEEQGLLPYSSNYSFLVVITHEDLALPAVYKPRRGENPLWDFEQGTLCLRETAAYVVSNALGWQLVPTTVLREGPHGIGSVQFYVDNDPNIHYFTVQDDARFTEAIRQMALFDFMINNADRKSGHCLVGTDERMWAIDHGIAFHAEYKLRTVIWEFSNQPIEETTYQDIAEIATQLADSTSTLSAQLSQLIRPHEYHALQQRIDQLLVSHLYPSQYPYIRNYPWPPV